MDRTENPISWGQYWRHEPLVDEYALGWEWAPQLAGPPDFFKHRPRGRGLIRV